MESRETRKRTPPFKSQENRGNVEKHWGGIQLKGGGCGESSQVRKARETRAFQEPDVRDRKRYTNEKVLPLWSSTHTRKKRGMVQSKDVGTIKRDNQRQRGDPAREKRGKTGAYQISFNPKSERQQSSQ